MRRLLVLASVILLAAGCSADKGDADPSAAPAPSAGGPAASAPAASAPAASAPAASAPAASAPAPTSAGATPKGDAARTGNTAAICSQAAKLSSEFAATFARNRKLQTEAASANDAAAARKAEQRSVQDVQSYSYALIDMSKLAADKAVAKALGDVGRQVGAFKADVSSIDEEKLAGLRTTLDKACGKA